MEKMERKIKKQIKCLLSNTYIYSKLDWAIYAYFWKKKLIKWQAKLHGCAVFNRIMKLYNFMKESWTCLNFVSVQWQLSVCPVAAQYSLTSDKHFLLREQGALFCFLCIYLCALQSAWTRGMSSSDPNSSNIDKSDSVIKERTYCQTFSFTANLFELFTHIFVTI